MGVEHYGRVQYEDVYPGVNLVYYGTNQRQLEYDFVIAPGADPNVIRMHFDGVDALRIDDRRASRCSSLETRKFVQQSPVSTSKTVLNGTLSLDRMFWQPTTKSDLTSPRTIRYLPVDHRSDLELFDVPGAVTDWVRRLLKLPWTKTATRTLLA